VAVLLGYFLGGEGLSLRTIVGTMLVLVSVVVITTTPKKQVSKPPQVREAAETVNS
jgi:drug/metabolite transporter (DMT)-like permease